MLKGLQTQLNLPRKCFPKGNLFYHGGCLKEVDTLFKPCRCLIRCFKNTVYFTIFLTT